jgi:citrate/tricarballylate utilization protein
VRQLEALAREAEALGAGGFPAATNAPAAALGSAEAEVGRVLQICNACRYCEGFCAVFPAMTRRLEFGRADIRFMANLCHNCGACLHACQYAPPHEFAVNVPSAMARVRAETYAAYAWPRMLGVLYARNGVLLATALTVALCAFLLLAVARVGPLWRSVDGHFYAIFPHGLLVSLFGPVLLLAVLALGIGVRRFWREQAGGSPSGVAAAEATGDVLRLTYLGGGHGEGCNEADDRFTPSRRRFHHLVFYGFLLCFAATVVATFDHYALGRVAPYPLVSAPKLLGTAGGLALVVGSVGLFVLQRRRHALQQDPMQQTMDRGFVALLFLTAASGLVLMALRRTPALPLALCLHLGSVMALFVTLPYGKFVHGIYRAAALLMWSIERRLPTRLRLADD